MLVTCLVLGGCSFFEAKPQLRGNHVDADQLKELVPGTTTRADVTALIGSPTARATFDDNTWLYVSEVTRRRIARTDGVLSQKVVVLSFNDQGVLQDVKQVNQDEAVPVSIVARSTPSPGTEASFLQQLFGNIGRFNAIGPNPTAPSGGAPAPAYRAAAGASRARADQCQMTSAAATMVGGTTTRFSAAQPPVASIAPEANAVHATVPNTMKSLVA
jgi:outer membrane protein assembly factor BamE (lipoprotein component of BamABCDE complex)